MFQHVNGQLPGQLNVVVVLVVVVVVVVVVVLKHFKNLKYFSNENQMCECLRF